MTFKNSIQKETAVAYRDMLTGNTIRPLVGIYSTDSTSVYSRKRNEYYSRLGLEKSKFNSAVNEIKRTEERRLARERDVEAKRKRDRRRARWINLPLIFATLLSLAVTIFLIPMGSLEWVAEEFIPSAAFKNFFDPTGEGQLAFFTAVGIAVLAIIIASIIYIKENGFAEFGGVVIGALGALLFLGSLILGILFCVSRLLVFVLSYLAFALLGSLCPILLFVASIVLMIIFGKKMELKRNRIATIVKIVIAIVLAIILFGVADSIAMAVGYGIL